MAKKIKARKHALRKAVTATVLAGTAFGTMGGAIGTVRTVKADEFRSSLNKGKDYDALINVATSVQNHDPNALNQLREVLKNFSTESLHSLLLGLDNAHLQYKHSQLTSFSNIIGTFNNDNKKDFYHKSLNLVSLLIQELRSRIISNENRGKLLEEKEVTIKEKQQELDKTKKALQDLFESKLKMAKREAKHSEDLNNKIEDLNKKLASEKKKYEIATRDAANLFIQRESIQKEADKYKNEAKVMPHSLEQAKQEFDQKAKEAEVANNRVIVLSNALNQAKEEFDLKAAEAQKLNNNVTVLSNALQQAKEEFDKKAQDYQAALAEKDAIDGQLETALTKVSDLESQLASLKEANEAANQKITQLEQEVADGGVAFKDLKGQKEKSDAQVKAQADKIKELESDLEATQSELNQVKEQRANLEQEVAELGTKVKDLEKEKADLEKKAIDLEADKAELEAEMDRLKALLADKDLANDKLLKEMEDLQKDFDTKKNHSDREIADFQAEIARLQKELADQLAKMNIAHPQNQGLGKAMAASPMTDSHKASTDAKNNLPSTGDVMANPFFTASAMAIIIGAGGLALNRKRKEA